MDNKALFNKYYDACGEHNVYKFPAFTLSVNYYKKRLAPNLNTPSEFKRDYENAYVERFKFLRTEDGYKLYEVAWRE